MFLSIQKRKKVTNVLKGSPLPHPSLYSYPLFLPPFLPLLPIVLPLSLHAPPGRSLQRSGYLIAPIASWHTFLSVRRVTIKPSNRRCRPPPNLPLYSEKTGSQKISSSFINNIIQKIYHTVLTYAGEKNKMP